MILLADIRLNRLLQWLQSCFQTSDIVLSSLDGDAGFRRYFRFTHSNKDYIAVDAPKDYCNNEQFVYISNYLSKLGIRVPKIHHYDKENGYFCLEDLGKTLLADVLTPDSVEAYYQSALSPLYLLSKADISQVELPDYDAAFIHTELNIFTEWLLDKHLALTLTVQEQKLIAQTNEVLVASALEQPKVVMHRDYHSRNIMLSNLSDLSVIDFQDAVKGPITYDVVSLLRDCYVRWPTALVNKVFDNFCEHVSQELALSVSKEQWRRWFDLMGMQRHIKASGIFARLNYRDGKTHYMKDIPLTLNYIVDVCKLYPELSDFGQFVERRVLSSFQQGGNIL